MACDISHVSAVQLANGPIMCTMPAVSSPLADLVMTCKGLISQYYQALTVPPSPQLFPPFLKLTFSTPTLSCPSASLRI